MLTAIRRRIHIHRVMQCMGWGAGRAARALLSSVGTIGELAMDMERVANTGATYAGHSSTRPFHRLGPATTGSRLPSANSMGCACSDARAKE